MTPHWTAFNYLQLRLACLQFMFLFFWEKGFSQLIVQSHCFVHLGFVDLRKSAESVIKVRRFSINDFHFFNVHNLSTYFNPNILNGMHLLLNPTRPPHLSLDTEQFLKVLQLFLEPNIRKDYRSTFACVLKRRLKTKTFTLHDKRDNKRCWTTNSCVAVHQHTSLCYSIVNELNCCREVSLQRLCWCILHFNYLVLKIVGKKRLDPSCDCKNVSDASALERLPILRGLNIA